MHYHVDIHPYSSSIHVLVTGDHDSVVKINNKLIVAIVLGQHNFNGF